MTTVEDVIIQWIRENFEQRRSMTHMDYLDSNVGKVNIDSCLFLDRYTRQVTCEHVELTCFDRGHTYLHSFSAPLPEDLTFLKVCQKGLQFTEDILRHDRWMKSHGFTGEGYIRYSQELQGAGFRWSLVFERMYLNKTKVDVYLNDNKTRIYEGIFDHNIIPYCVLFFFDTDFERVAERTTSVGIGRLDIVQSLPDCLKDILVNGIRYEVKYDE